MNQTRKNTALLLIEFQKTWTDKGLFAWLVRKELRRQNTLRNTISLANKARANDIAVIQAPLILDKSDKFRYSKTPLPARIFGFFKKGSENAEFSEGIYKKEDSVIKGRYGFDACLGSNLQSTLSQMGIEYVYLCGFVTDHCVKETTLSLIDKGLSCKIVSDCTAAMKISAQRQIEQEFDCVSCISTDELFEQLTN